MKLTFTENIKDGQLVIKVVTKAQWKDQPEDVHELSGDGGYWLCRYEEKYGHYWLLAKFASREQVDTFLECVDGDVTFWAETE